ncbi:MAG: hypothetical protein LBV43_01685 [Prevotella sp.]|nr:hypothetical protein [Prevotella sp.]
MGAPPFKYTDAGLKHDKEYINFYNFLSYSGVSLLCISSQGGHLSGAGGVDANGRSRLFASAGKPLTGRRGTKH